jgi:hypothetical protein
MTPKSGSPMSMSTLPLPPKHASAAAASILIGRPYHLMWLVASVVVLMLACSLRISDQHMIVVPGWNVTIPRICSLQWLGLSCPACGLTRSFVACGHGQFDDAFRFHPAGPLWFAAAIGQIPFRWTALRRPEFPRTSACRRLANVLMPLLMSALFAGWLCRLAGIVPW